MLKYSKYNDEILTTLLVQGDHLAYAEIFERYSRLLVNHAYKMLGNQDEANDVVQEVFMTIWDKKEKIEIKIALSSYLYKATRNRVLNYISHQKVVKRYADSIQDFIENTQIVVDENLREQELHEIIQKEIALLPTKMREVFLLRKEEELSYDEIAKRLNISDKTAKQQVYNSLKILKEKLKFHLNILLF